jgi:hypothetical protein
VDDLTGEQLTAKSLVFQFDSAEVVNGEGHAPYCNVGEGPASVVLDGPLIEPPGSSPRARSAPAIGTSMVKRTPYNRGTGWIPILPDGSPLT